MTPTNELRFVERTREELKLTRDGFEDYVTCTTRVLQQKWVRDFHPDVGFVQPFGEEWRDVPCVKEGK